MMANLYKAKIGKDYRLFFEQAGLTPAQIEEIENVTADLWNKRYPPSFSPGPSYELPEDQLPEDQLRGILSDQAFQQLHDFERMTVATSLVHNIRLSTDFVGVSLSSDQEVQLAQIVANNSPSYQAGNHIDLSSVDWATVETQAQNLLSPFQWTAAKESLRATEWDFQYRNTLRLDVLNARQYQKTNPTAGSIGK